MVRIAVLLASLWLLLAAGCGPGRPAERPTDGALRIEGSVEAVGWHGRAWYVVAAAGVTEFYAGTFLAQTRVAGEGPYSLDLPAPPERLWIWLVEDRDADGPDPFDPHAPASLTPIEVRDRARIRLTLSGAQHAFEDPDDPGGWRSWLADPRAGRTMMALFAAGLGLLAFSAWWRGRGPGVAQPLRRRGLRDLMPQGREAWVLGALVALAAVLRVAAALAPGDNAGLTEMPYLALTSAGPQAPPIRALVADPFYLVSRHPLAFVVLLRALVLALPAQVIALRLALGVLGLGAVWAAWALTRMAGSPRAALLAAALVATAPMAAHFGASLSPHGLHLLLLGISLLFLARGLVLDDAPSRALWALASTAGVWVLQEHAAYLAFQTATLLVLAWWPRAGLRRAAARALGWALLPMAVTIPPQLFVMVWSWRLSRADGLRVGLFGFERLPPADNLLQTVELMAGLPTGLVGLAPVALALLAVGVPVVWRRARGLTAVLLGSLAGFVAVDLAFLALNSAAIGDHLQYTGHWCVGLVAVLSPVLGLSLDRLLGAATERWRARGVQRLLATGLALGGAAPFVWQLAGVGQVVLDSGLPATDAAAAVVAARLQEGDVLVSGSGLPHQDVMDRAVRAARPAAELSGPCEGWAQPVELCLERRAIRRVWLFGFSEERFGRPKIDHTRLLAWRRAWLAQRFVEQERWSFRNLELFLYERPEERLTVGQGEALALSSPLDLLRAVTSPPRPGGGLRLDRHAPLAFGFSAATPLRGPWTLELDTEGSLAAGCLTARIGDCTFEPAGEEPWRGTTGACEPIERIALTLAFGDPCEGPVEVRGVRLQSAAPAP